MTRKELTERVKCLLGKHDMTRPKIVQNYICVEKHSYCKRRKCGYGEVFYI